MNISIVIFCYNERDTIDSVIRSSMEVAEALSSDYEIIVVDDGSDDGTSDRIKAAPGVIYIRHHKNLGIGQALRSGYAAASKDFICAVPGDGQFDVNELLKIKPFDDQVVCAFYRKRTNYNLYRSTLTACNKMFNKVLLNMDLKDINWIKVYRKSQLDFVDIRLESSIVESEICAKLIRAGCKINEYPSVYHERKGGVAKGGNWRTLWKAMQEMATLYNTVRVFKKKLPAK